MSELLQEMYPLAVEAGIPAEKYWSMSYEEVLIQVQANKKIYERDMKAKAMLDYKQAQLNAYALNDPKKMPSFTVHYPIGDEEQPVNPEGDPSKGQQQPWQIMKARMMDHADAIKKTRERKSKLTGGEGTDGTRET